MSDLDINYLYRNIWENFVKIVFRKRKKQARGKELSRLRSNPTPWLVSDRSTVFEVWTEAITRTPYRRAHSTVQYSYALSPSSLSSFGCSSSKLVKCELANGWLKPRGIKRMESTELKLGDPKSLETHKHTLLTYCN